MRSIKTRNLGLNRHLAPGNQLFVILVAEKNNLVPNRIKIYQRCIFPASLSRFETSRPSTEWIPARPASISPEKSLQKFRISSSASWRRTGWCQETRPEVPLDELCHRTLSALATNLREGIAIERRMAERLELEGKSFYHRTPKPWGFKRPHLP